MFDVEGGWPLTVTFAHVEPLSGLATKSVWPATMSLPLDSAMLRPTRPLPLGAVPPGSRFSHAEPSGDDQTPPAESMIRKELSLESTLERVEGIPGTVTGVHVTPSRLVSSPPAEACATKSPREWVMRCLCTACDIACHEEASGETKEKFADAPRKNRPPK